MIVCSCNVFSDHQVRAAVQSEQNPLSTAQVYKCLGCSPQCGRCARTLRRIMDEAIVSGHAVNCEPIMDASLVQDRQGAFCVERGAAPQ
jgi:bacterioferritin-associated ferredoxin